MEQIVSNIVSYVMTSLNCFDREDSEISKPKSSLLSAESTDTLSTNNSEKSLSLLHPDTCQIVTEPPKPVVDIFGGEDNDNSIFYINSTIQSYHAGNGVDMSQYNFSGSFEDSCSMFLMDGARKRPQEFELTPPSEKYKRI